MTAGPPRPRSAPADAPLKSGDPDVRRLTAPAAYHMWAGVVGYHLPKRIAHVFHLSDSLRRMP